MKIKYLTTDEIIKIHGEIIKETGGHSGIISYGNIDFVVSQMEIPKTLERKAAILLFGILTSHPFVDGNKRTALESMKTFVLLNSRKFITSENDIWIKLHEISEGKLKVEETVGWIKKNMK
jgi:death-on-curing protein